MHTEAHLSRAVALRQEGPEVPEALNLSFLFTKLIPQNTGAYPEQPVPREPVAWTLPLQLPMKPGNSVEPRGTLPSRREGLQGTGYDMGLHGEEREEEGRGLRNNGDTEAPRGEESGSRSHHEYMVEPEFDPNYLVQVCPQSLY